MTDREQVMEAAAYLDEIKSDWWAHVDPVKLDLSVASLCICGQNGLDWQEHWHEMDDRLGFETFVFADRDLEPLWLEEIAARMPELARAGALA